FQRSARDQPARRRKNVAGVENGLVLRLAVGGRIGRVDHGLIIVGLAPIPVATGYSAVVHVLRGDQKMSAVVGEWNARGQGDFVISFVGVVRHAAFDG